MRFLKCKIETNVTICPYYAKIVFKMHSLHDSINHFGVDVAPQMPTLFTPSSNLKSISFASSIR